MLDLALIEQLPPTVVDYLVTARQAALSLSHSLELLVDLADAPDDPGRRDLLDLADVVYVAVADLAAAARRSDREILVRLLPDAPMRICGDAGRLEHIIRSLVEHSLKWLDGRRIVVEIAGRIDVGKAFLEIGVSEWGLGTAADRRDFIEYDASEASKYSSTGLGLAISQRWLETLGGGLWTDATTGCGRFYAKLELPLPDRFRHEPSPPVSPRSPVDRRTDGRQRMPACRAVAVPLHVLVVDDTPANQKVVQSVLRKRGHHVELADNGRQAVEQLRLHPFDVVLMDAQMPQMNGLEATAAIRDLPDHRRARVPIIAMTAHTLQEDRMRCLAAGMDDYLPKPLDVSDLVARVESLGEAARAKEQQKPSSDGQAETFLAATLARLGGDENLLHELIRLFQQDAQTLLDRVRVSVQSGDAETAARAAHNLRGLSANFDDEQTIASAGDIERAALAQDLPAAAAALPRLESSLERLLEALERFQAQTSD